MVEDVEPVAALLRALLDAVADGRLSADGSAGAALVRQMQGAAEALELLGTREQAARDSKDVY
jgi:hypothetical protein